MSSVSCTMWPKGRLPPIPRLDPVDWRVCEEAKARPTERWACWVQRRRMRSDNPVHGVMRPADGRRDRRLTDAEYEALGSALRRAAAVGIWPPAIAVARFLAVSGWRSGEALVLSWNEIDLARRTATLGDTKPGRSVRPLSHAACDVLRNLPRSGHLVFQ